MIDCEEEVPSRSGKRVDRIRQRASKMRVRVRYGQRELKRISRTATLGGLFLSFLKIGVVGFGGGLAVIAQIRTLTVRKRHWLNEFEFAEGFALALESTGHSGRQRCNVCWSETQRLAGSRRGHGRFHSAIYAADDRFGNPLPPPPLST